MIKTLLRVAAGIAMAVLLVYMAASEVFTVCRQGCTVYFKAAPKL